MVAPVREPDDGKPSKGEPLRSALAKGAPKPVSIAPSGRGTEETPDVPWRRSRRREAFEGDIALTELRSRLGPERIPDPVVARSTAPAFSGLLRLTSAVTIVAAVAGAAGYLWGFKLSTKTPELTRASRQANVPPALSTPAASVTVSSRDFDQPTAARTASTGLASVDTRGAADPLSSADAAQRSAALPTPRQTVSPSAALPRPVMTEDPSVIAAKMKIGVELMTYGEVAAARVMFQRAAEAGEGAGAFALAETYDPLVLGGLRLREGITPDVALARAWYERARDLGSLEARDRISRLAQLPQ
jgi:hypothetical protein